jgi:hypothetical protein
MGVDNIKVIFFSDNVERENEAPDDNSWGPSYETEIDW